MKRDKGLEEAAAKILSGEYVLNEAQAPDDFEGEYDDEKSPSTLELISKRKGIKKPYPPDDFEGEYDDEKSPSTLELISKRRRRSSSLEESDEPISYPYVTGLLTAYLEDITTKMAQNDIKVDSDTRNRIDELTAQLVADAKKEAREHYKKHGF